MKGYISILVCLLSLVFSSGVAGAQGKARITISGIVQKNGETLVTLHSTKHFIFANNKYYLHIGESEFSRCEQTKSGASGQMKFLIPDAEVAKLPNNAPVYLTYGRLSRDGSGLEVMSRDESILCWSLGMFNHSMIKK